MNAPRVLVVEDDPQLLGVLATLLGEEGYAVDPAADGQRGLHLGLTRSYDVLVLDRGLPVVDGLALLMCLRERGVVTPTLLLSALGNPADLIAVLDAGAEDYLAKPFDVGELLARLRALRRRHLDVARSLPLPGGRVDLDAQQVVRDDASAVRLSQRECALLATLATRPRHVFSRSQLLGLVFDDAGSEVVVDTYVHYLRRKLGRQIIDTVRGRGYQLGR
ncbi:MAG TPA: response regulator transcription factor [Amycolatopsis sp.]|uniref:response regulator transcription factor n=1 Tax=Amycolatopsis sp. TaxID=37632 RepID=UPI002B4737E3|nr:response regulator transcription factor [Amycolatopsis sp.]HKS46548.1 response regulator transcription factor [Amycolatopsis sp.]